MLKRSTASGDLKLHNSDSSPRATYFCVDIEANGPVPGLYDMVSIGIVVVTPTQEGTLKVGETLYIEFRPQAPRFDAQAAAIHGLDQDRLHKEGLPRAEACRQITAWVQRKTLKGTHPVFVGHNAPFDWSHVSWIFAAEDMPNPFGYKGLCTKALATGVLDIHWLDSNKEMLEQRLNLPAQDHSKRHRADYDAQYQALILIALLNRLETVP